tara:strand:+ start:1041 stop:1487 length:447 start_codon:yes stop_codon:yes gene_type:complete
MNKKSNKLHFNVGEYIEELEQINIRVNGKKVEKPVINEQVEKPVINEQTNLVNTDNETSNSSSLNNSLYIIFYLFFCLVFGFLYAGDNPSFNLIFFGGFIPLSIIGLIFSGLIKLVSKKRNFPVILFWTTLVFGIAAYAGKLLTLSKM